MHMAMSWGVSAVMLTHLWLGGIGGQDLQAHEEAEVALLLAWQS